jgi:hypothetical protein
MPKNKITRVNDTIAYIQNTPGAGLPQNIRNDIATMVTHATPRNTHQERQTFKQVSRSMSVKHQLEDGVVRGSDPQREARRAIVLLWTAIGGQNPCQGIVTRRDAAMRLPPNQLAAAFDEAMITAAVFASDLGAAWVFNNELSLNPLQFIQRFRLFINGSTAGKATFMNPLAGAWRNVMNFWFCYDHTDDIFYLEAQGRPNSHKHQMSVVNVPALHWTEVNGRGNVIAPTALNPASFSQMLGTELAGATFMVTTQLTGCVFSYMGNGANVWASHTMPGGAVNAMPAATLANQIMGNVLHVTAGDFANYPGLGANPPLRVFGMTAGNAPVVGGGNPFYPQRTPFASVGTARFITILGRLFGGSWEIYCQAVDHGGTIMEARQVL